MVGSTLGKITLLGVHTRKLGLEALRKEGWMGRSKRGRESGKRRAAGWTQESLWSRQPPWNHSTSSAACKIDAWAGPFPPPAASRAADGGAISDSVTHSLPVHHGPSELWSPAVRLHAKPAESRQGQGSPWRTPLPCRFPGLPKYFMVLSQLRFLPLVAKVHTEREKRQKTKQKSGKGRPTESQVTHAAE